MPGLRALPIPCVLLLAGCGAPDRKPGTAAPPETEAIAQARTMLATDSVSANAVTPSTEKEQR